MGIFDFLRKKIEELKSGKEEAAEQQPEIKHRIIFEEIGELLFNKKKDNTEKEERTVEDISVLISELIEELKKENEEIKKVDLKNRKEEQRIKNIVLENLSNYSSYVGKLIESLESLEKKNLQKLVRDINKTFLDFRQKTKLSFEKATFLVGRELERVKESIRNFFERVKEIEEQNKDIFQDSDIILLIEKKLEEIKELENSKTEVMNEIKEAQKKVQKAETEEKILEDDIKKIKNSREYALWEKSRQEANLKKKEIEKEIFEAKNRIDWKNLLKIFHTNEKKMVIIKEYESHFSQILHEGREKEFLEVLDEANLKIEGFSHKISEIKKRTKEINDILNRKDRLEELASQIMGIRADIKTFNAEKEKVFKRIQRVDENIAEIKKIICEEAGKLGISVKS